MQDQIHIIPTGYQFVKDGISLNFQVDLETKKVMLVGNKTMKLDTTQARQLIQIIETMIQMIELEAESFQSKKEIDFENLPELE